MDNTKTENQPSLEQVLNQLEETVKRLSAEIPLEEALRLYEQGVGLAAQANTRIRSARQRLTELGNNPQGGTE